MPPAIPNENSVPAESAGEADLGTGAHVTWKSDNPLQQPSEDRLGRATFARGVAAAIRERTDLASIVVGLYGPWGDGKSTVLNFVEAELATPEIVVVQFNPWLISDEAGLLPAFFAEVARELDVKIGGARRQVGNALRMVGQFFGSVSVSGDGAAAAPGSMLGGVADGIASTSLQALRTDFEKALEEAGKRVVVIIDDLDRLDDREIRSMFRLIRLAAPFDRLTYLVACDETVVARALGAMQGSSYETGLAYLEKIVQVPLHIPPASEPALTELALEGLDAILVAAGITYTDDEAREIGGRYRDGLAPAFRTPRSIKRLHNALAFALPLLKGEANPADVIAVEGIHVAYPTVYRALRENRDWFLNPQPGFSLGRDDAPEKKTARDRIETCLPVSPPDREAALGLLRRLFPKVDSLWSNSYSRDASEWYAQQRMASTAYYERYLSYALPVGEVSDQEFQSLISDPASLGTSILEILSSRGSKVVGSLASKIDARMELLSPDARGKLVAVLPLLGGFVMSRGAAQSGLFGYSLQERLANVIARLVARYPVNMRMAVAQSVISNAEPLSFSVECYRALHRRDSETQGPPFDDGSLERLEQALGNRIVDALDAETPLWASEPLWTTLLWIASKGVREGEVRRLIGGWLRAPEAVDILLTGLAGKATNLGTGQVVQQDFTTQTYESLRALADLEGVREAIRARYGEPIVTSYPPDASYVRDSTRAVVEQFLFVDAKAKEAASEADAPEAPGDSA